MILVDTSVWISFLRKDDPDLQDILKNYLKTNEVYAVSAVFGELLQGTKNQRERNLISLLWESLPKLEEQNTFVKAGKLSNEHALLNKGVGLIDSYILTLAVENKLALWTLDKKLASAYDAVL